VKETYPDKNIWIYSGLTLEELLNRKDTVTNEILKNVNTLVDGRFIEELKDLKLKFRGSSNQRILNMEEYFKIKNLENMKGVKDMKTLKDWENSNVNTFDDFFIPGDIVGEDVVKHFRNVQIPITDNAYLMQMGEAQDCIDGKTTYMTFSKEQEGWIYKGDCHKGAIKTPFEKWIDTFIEEKGIDTHEQFKITNGSISKVFSYEDVLTAIKTTSKDEQAEIKNMLVAIDYKNGDIKDYLRHLSKVLITTIENMEEPQTNFNQEVIINPILHFKGEIIPGLNENEIYRQIKSYLNEYLVQSDLDTDIINVQLVGSRTKGTFDENSDIDVLVEYNNPELREDDLFNRIK